MKRLLTIREAGEESGLGARFIRRLVEEQDIASYKLRGKVMVSEADLMDYIESCRRDAGSSAADGQRARLRHADRTVAATATPGGGH